MRVLISHDNGAVVLAVNGSHIELFSALSGQDNTLSVPLYEMGVSGEEMDDMMFVLKNACKLEGKALETARDFIERVVRRYA